MSTSLTSIEATVGTWRRLLTLMRPSHPVRHRWPLRNHRFFCSRFRAALLEERIGNADTFHALGYRSGFVRGGVEAGIGSDQLRRASQLRLMQLDGRDQQVHIAGPLRENLI